jgi:hypothetical protein
MPPGRLNGQASRANGILEPQRQPPALFGKFGDRNVDARRASLSTTVTVPHKDMLRTEEIRKSIAEWIGFRD